MTKCDVDDDEAVSFYAISECVYFLSFMLTTAYMIRIRAYAYQSTPWFFLLCEIFYDNVNDDDDDNVRLVDMFLLYKLVLSKPDSLSCLLSSMSLSPVKHLFLPTSTLLSRLANMCESNARDKPCLITLLHIKLNTSKSRLH